MKNRIVLLVAGFALAAGLALSAPVEARTDLALSFSIGGHTVNPGYGGYFYVDQRHGHRAYSRFYFGGQAYPMQTRWVQVHQRWREVYYLPPAVYAPQVPLVYYTAPVYYQPAPAYGAPAYQPAPQAVQTKHCLDGYEWYPESGECIVMRAQATFAEVAECKPGETRRVPNLAYPGTFKVQECRKR